jgi:hypothetical protein
MNVGQTLASRTAGKRTLKPQRVPLAAEIPGRSRLSGKGLAQITSTTRTAIEDPNHVMRGTTDFSRTVSKRIEGHGREMTRLAQGRRDAKNLPL